MVRVGLRFLDKDNNLGNKTYWYLVKDKKVWKDLKDAATLSIGTQNSTAFKITNETGYNYRDAWVVWVDVDRVKDGDEKNLVVIKKVRAEETVRPRKKISIPVWGFCGVDLPEFYDCCFPEPEPHTLNWNGDPKATIEFQDSAIYINTHDDYNPLKVSFDGPASIAINTCEPENYKLNSISSFCNGTWEAATTFDISEEMEKLIYGEKSDKINTENEKENTKMNMKFLDTQFGKVDDVAMSIYGATFKTVGTDGLVRHIAFDPQTEEYIDIPDEMILAKGSYCYAMPATADTLHIGEYIRHNGAWARVIDVDDAARLVVEKIATREVATILPVRSMFGYSFYTKLITPFQSGFMTADAAHPFGNILPFLMMGEGDGKMSEMLPLMLMSQNGMAGLDISNPFMLMMLMGDKADKGSDMFKMMMMASLFSQAKPKAKSDAHFCECDCCDTERKSY